MMPSYQRLFALLLLTGLIPTALAQTPEALRDAQIMVAQGHYARAATSLEAVGRDALSPQGAHLLGRCYQALLRHEQAVAAFAQADTANTAVLVDWGRSLERLGLPEEAETFYQTAYRRDSTSQQVAVSYARLLADRNAWTEVSAIYQRLLKVDSENSFLHAQLGAAFAKLDSTDQAIIHYERAHALNTRNITVALALTKVYYDIDYIISAKRVLARALAERPRSVPLWRRSGELALKEEAYPEAVEAYTNALQYSPDSTAQDLSRLGVSYYLTGDFSQALPLLQQSFDLNDKDEMNAFYLGMAYQQHQQYERALHYLTHAANLLGQGMLANIHARIGNTHEQANQQQEAIRAYRLTLDLDEERVEVLFHLAGVYDAYYADKQMAFEQFERFLERVGEDQLPQMQRYAQQRVQEIREKKFFEEGRTPPPTDLDTLVIQPADSSDSKGQ